MTSTRILVAGTETGAGKTWVAANVVRHLRDAGVPVAVRKPVQSFAPDTGPTDADVLALASGETPIQVCPHHRWYPLAMAPPMAAAQLGRDPFTIADLAAETIWPEAGLAVVEPVGGPLSPLATDGDSITLARAMGIDLVVVVADAGLGAINASRLAAQAFARWPVVVMLNRFDSNDPVHCSNLHWLTDRDGLSVVTEIEVLVSHLGVLNGADLLHL